MILHHSAIPRPDPIHTPTPRTPSSDYARCDDCGTSQGEPCYDSHDRPCAPCPGRVLASTGAERREAQERAKRPPPKPGPRRKSRAHPGPPSTCTVCGVVVQRGGRFCRAHQKERLQDLYARRLAARVVPCWWCGVALPIGQAIGRGAECDRPCCGEHACKRAIKRDLAERSRNTTPRETEQRRAT